MNSEPSGTDEDIPGGENAIDIFILCKDARDSQQLIGQLTPAGYRITLFSESTDLVESLHAGKPNLLICDTTDPEQDGYKICREIKRDDDLWRIPVLLITGIASLGDLLIVLDSNADNFIARPYDTQYLLSLVEMMLASPVEKPDPEKVRTQFKIQHEDREYVITADRRKLLEFLLSSFEIAVGRAADLGQTQSALDGLKSTLERRVAERTSELSTEMARLQTIANGQVRDLNSARTALAGLKTEGETLRLRLEEREKDIAGKADELSRLTQELESARARLAEAEDTVRTLGTDKDELEHALRGDAETLNRDLEQTRTELSATKEELEEVSRHHAELETQLTELTHDHAEAEKTLGTRSIEIEQIKGALVSERNRADSAEQEVKSILQEKARSEQDLRQMIEDITGKAKQLSMDSLRLADELAEEKECRIKAEQQYNELAQEAAKKEAAFVAEKGTFMEHHDALQQKYDALTESVGAERQKGETREADLARVTSEKEQIAGEMHALHEQFDATVASLEEEKRLRAGAEKSAQEIFKTKNGEIQALNTTLESLRQELETARAGLVLAERERDAALGAHRSSSDDLAAAVLAKAQSDKLARSAASETEQVREELETERRQRHATEEKLSEVTQVKEKLERNLNDTGEYEQELLAKIQGLSDNLITEREAHRIADEKLSEVMQVKENLERNLNDTGEHERELLAKIQGLSDNLITEREAHRIADEKLSEVMQVKENLERELLAKIQGLSDNLVTEREAHRITDEKLSEVMQVKENLERNLNDTGEHERELLAKIQGLSDNLIAEREAHRIADEALLRAAREKEQAEQKLRAITCEKSADDARREDAIKELGDDLRTALDRQRSLEEQLRNAEREQAEKEATVQSLATEIEQAVSTLAAEKERRYAAEEECVEAKEALATLRKRSQIPSALIEEVPIQNQMIVTKGPDLPAVIMHGPQALSRKEIDHKVPLEQLADPKRPDPATETDVPQVRILSMEDLFEEPRELDIDDLSDAIPVSAAPPDSMAERIAPEIDDDDTTGTAGDDDTGPDEGNPDEAGTTTDDDEANDDATDESDDDSTSGGDENADRAATAGLAFGRQQWFDLMKWAHNTDTLSHEDRIRFIKLGRLIQKGRRLTRRQEAQLAELVTLARAMGYQVKP